MRTLKNLQDVNNKEAKRQQDFIIAFSHMWPDIYADGMLFEINNDIKGKNKYMEIMFRKSIGMQPGAPDLFLAPYMTGFELKHEETKHKKDHLEVQQNWGRNLSEKYRGNYIMSHDVDELMQVAEDVIVKKKSGIFIVNNLWCV